MKNMHGNELSGKEVLLGLFGALLVGIVLALAVTPIFLAAKFIF